MANSQGARNALETNEAKRSRMKCKNCGRANCGAVLITLSDDAHIRVKKLAAELRHVYLRPVTETETVQIAIERGLNALLNDLKVRK